MACRAALALLVLLVVGCQDVNKSNLQAVSGAAGGHVDESPAAGGTGGLAQHEPAECIGGTCPAAGSSGDSPAAGGSGATSGAQNDDAATRAGTAHADSDAGGFGDDDTVTADDDASSDDADDDASSDDVDDDFDAQDDDLGTTDDDTSDDDLSDAQTTDAGTLRPEPDIDVFDDLTAAADPETVGRRLIDLFLREGIHQQADTDKHYKQACAWYGALAVAALLEEDSLIGALTEAYTPLLDSYAALLAGDGHVDNNVFGIVPLEIALHTSDPDRYLADGLALAGHQVDHIEQQIRFAIDDMFMITGLQVQAYRASSETRHLDVAASTMVRYLDRLQQPDGTFYHHEDVLIKWGRGNGWVAAGMTEMMRELDATHPDHERIQAGYQLMMSGLLDYQIQSGEGAGLWQQVLDDDSASNWPETSGSAMFAYALVSGVKNGWLASDPYGPAAKAAWEGLVTFLESDGKLRNVSDWMWDGSVGDYLARGRVAGDNHGQAPMLWTVYALLR